MMKWSKETKAYCWANYYSEDGNWKAWCEEKLVESNRKKYNPLTKKNESISTFKVWWVLQNMKSGEIIDKEFKTLKAAKEFAEG